MVDASATTVEPAVLAEIAFLASNLTERRRIVERLAARRAPKADPAQLDAFEAWKVRRLSEKLDVQSQNDSFRHVGVAATSSPELETTLLDFALYLQSLPEFSDGDRQELLAPHAAWLGTYGEALRAMALPPETFDDCRWRDSEVYHGSYAKVCEPFLRLLHRELIDATHPANPAGRTLRFLPQVVADIELHWLRRLELALAWALETDISVYCVQNKIDRSHQEPPAFAAYLDATFTDAPCYHRFYCKFPVLARWLAQLTAFERINARDLVRRLAADRHELSDHFFGGRPVLAVRSLRMGKSDCHAGGRSVVLVDLELEGAEPATVVYKPRCIVAERAMQGLLSRLSGEAVGPFATFKVLCKDDYGYAELIPSGRNQVEDEAAVERLYRQLGGYLAVFYILGGTDLHFENILVADGNAFICDCETVLSVTPEGMDVHVESFGESVFRTGMLEWPRAEITGPNNALKLSGYLGGESYEVPFAVPRINEARTSLGLRVEYLKGVKVEQSAPNRILYQGRVVDPGPYKSCILDGFNSVYGWFERQPGAASSCVNDLFAGASVRFVNWGTQAYAHLLMAVRHPKCLADPVEVDLIYNVMRFHHRQWDTRRALAAREIEALWLLDVPIFTAKSDGRTLVSDHRDAMPVGLACSPLENADRRIHGLSRDNRARQNQYIGAGLSTNEIKSIDFVAAAEDYARQIGYHLYQLMRTAPGAAPWTTYDLASRRTVDIGIDLYDGATGIGLFLAWLDAITPDAKFRRAAEHALDYALRQAGPAKIGAFEGLAGLVYLLTHLGALWEDPSLIERACDLTRRIIPMIESDRQFDVLGGVAGAIPVVLGLAAVAGGGPGLDVARLCADHLLEFAQERDGTLSWATVPPEMAVGNLTGFAHGTAGIGWALIGLGAQTDRPEYVDAGLKAFAYEGRHFDPVARDWYDLRTSGMTADASQRPFSNSWCNGAAGIGLARIASWDVLGRTNEELLRDAYTAMNATLRNFHLLSGDSLCHGRLGNTELFLRLAVLRDEPSLQMEANVQVQARWRNHAQTREWISSERSVDVFPGLMLGLSGCGLHFLRLAHPERVPSPLLLDPLPLGGLRGARPGPDEADPQRQDVNA